MGIIISLKAFLRQGAAKFLFQYNTENGKYKSGHIGFTMLCNTYTVLLSARGSSFTSIFHIAIIHIKQCCSALIYRIHHKKRESNYEQKNIFNAWYDL